MMSQMSLLFILNVAVLFAMLMLAPMSPQKPFSGPCLRGAEQIMMIRNPEHKACFCVFPRVTGIKGDLV